MPEKRWQKLIFAFITVVITVNLFVFYNLSYVNGLNWDMLNTYGVPMLGRACPVWAVILVEFVLAFLIESLFVGELAPRLALKVVDPRENKPFMVETAIICATVGIMCPIMSLLAVFLYSDLSVMSVDMFFAAWLRTVMHNLPLAFFSQLLFIQPFVRAVFKRLSRLWSRPGATAAVN